MHLLMNGSFASSHLRWTAVLWLIAVACAFLVHRISGDADLAFAAFSFCPLFIAILVGHDTVIVLLGILLCAHLLSQGKDLLAGVALSLTALKPHFAIFLAIPLISRPKALLGLIAGSSALALYSIWLIGAKGVSEFIDLLRLSALGEGFGMHPLAMFNLLGLMERAGLNATVVRPAAWIIFFLAAFFSFIVWKQNPQHPPFALTTLLAVVTSPHLHAHDLSLLLVSFVTLSKPNALFLLLASQALGVLFLNAGNWLFAVTYCLLGILLVISLKDLREQRSLPARQ
jgi:hypothetical protein